MIPFKFTVKGPPLSQQAKRSSQEKWKTRVRQAAEGALPDGSSPVVGEVAISVVYYYEGETPDVDNIIKPIQDALKGVVYVDDGQIVKASSAKTRIDGSFRIRGASATLLQAFSQNDPFVYVCVDFPPDMSNLT